NDLDLLEKFDKRLKVTDLLSKYEEANRALERVRKQAKAKENQFKADNDAKEQVLKQEKEKLKDVGIEIEKCRIYSPQDGLVVYYMPEQSRFGSGSQQSIIAQGEPVREGQKLMRIPTLRKMQINARVHEAMVSRLKNESFKLMRPAKEQDLAREKNNPPILRVFQLGRMFDPNAWDHVWNIGTWHDVRDHLRDTEYDQYFEGHKALIRVDAHQSILLHGRVTSVANVASQAEFFSSDVKVYQTLVRIDDESMQELEDLSITLKPGMSAEVTILAEAKSEEVLTIPIQSVVGTIAPGAKRKCFVLDRGGEPELRDVELGRSNEKMVEVLKGLSEGDKVVLNPQPLLVGENSKLKPASPGGKRGMGGM